MIHDSASIIKQATEYFSSRAGIDYVFLFGSALKRMHANSDIDFLIQGHVTTDDCFRFAADLEILFKRRTDIVRVNSAPSSLVLKAMSQGALLLVNNREVLKKDYFRNLYDAENFRFLRERMRIKLKETITRGR